MKSGIHENNIKIDPKGIDCEDMNSVIVFPESCGDGLLIYYESIEM